MPTPHEPHAERAAGTAKVNQIVWLASYPKSGNTWLRLLIGGLSLSEGEALDLNSSILNDGNANMRALADELSLIETGMLTHDELERLRPDVYADLSRNPDAASELLGVATRPLPFRFLKVHGGYTLGRTGRPVLGGGAAARAALVIVRDPRDIVPSLAPFFDITIDAAIDMLNDDGRILQSHRGRQDPRLAQTLMGWSANVASWLDQRDLPIHLIRYEDLLGDTVAVLRAALRAVGLEVTTGAMARAAALCRFDRLQAQEQTSGFVEGPGSGAAFFRRGQAGAWRDELTLDQVRRIEAAHGPMMARLGYDPSRA